MYICKGNLVLVPFYRGAVVFSYVRYIGGSNPCSRPLLSRSGCIYNMNEEAYQDQMEFSSPFIEERLYFVSKKNMHSLKLSSRPLLSRSGCISKISGDAEVYGDAVLVPFYRGAVVFNRKYDNHIIYNRFSSPFIEERLYFVAVRDTHIVLLVRSRPLLSRSGCILLTIEELSQRTSWFSSPFIEERLYLYIK